MATASAEMKPPAIAPAKFQAMSAAASALNSSGRRLHGFVRRSRTSLTIPTAIAAQNPEIGARSESLRGRRRSHQAAAAPRAE